MPTHIQWTDETWNVATGCDRCSPGCDHCYIERTIPFRTEGRVFDEHGKMGVRLHPDRMAIPLRWKRPRFIFVNSLSDLFHPDIPDDYIGQVFDVIRDAPQHRFQVLTKRPQRMADWTWKYYDCDHGGEALPGCRYCVPYENGWLGTSIENGSFRFRANYVRESRAALRWISFEPLIGPIWDIDLTGISWAVIGGESGPGARPMDLAWARYLVEMCREAGVAPFVKQLGSCWSGRGHKDLKGGDIDTFPEDLRIREMPERSHV